MTAWPSQLYRKKGRKLDVDRAILDHAIVIAKEVGKINPQLPPVFSLKHLSHLSDADYGLIRAVVSRSLDDPYRIFRIKKRPSENGEKRFRVICVPDPVLMRVQRWIAQNILANGQQHSASIAYAKESTIAKGASVHCGCRWLIKLDVRNVFESINEISVYRVFRSFGYQPLVAFELTRLCTRLGSLTALRRNPRNRVFRAGYERITAYNHDRMGYLPQGAPTSPMLANLAMRDFDAAVEKIAISEDLAFTRYADDITLSTDDKSFTRERARKIIGQIYLEMSRVGLSPNVAKARVVPPGSRKVVLGLLVDGPKPRLTRDFKATLRRHLHYLRRADVGPSKHAQALGFSSIAGMKNHISGLVAFAYQIEPIYGRLCRDAFKNVLWPV